MELQPKPQECTCDIDGAETDIGHFKGCPKDKLQEESIRENKTFDAIHRVGKILSKDKPQPIARLPKHEFGFDTITRKIDELVQAHNKQIK